MLLQTPAVIGRERYLCSDASHLLGTPNLRKKLEEEVSNISGINSPLKGLKKLTVKAQNQVTTW